MLGLSISASAFSVICCSYFGAISDMKLPSYLADEIKISFRRYVLEALQRVIYIPVRTMKLMSNFASTSFAGLKVGMSPLPR